MRFDHLGLIVPDLRGGKALLRDSLGIADWTEPFEEPEQDVLAQFGRCPSGICYELLAPRSEKSPVARALATRTNTLNHVAYLVADLHAEGGRLLETGFIPAGPVKPGIVFGGHPMRFFVSPGRLMIELIEAPDHRHAFTTG